MVRVPEPTSGANFLYRLRRSGRSTIDARIPGVETCSGDSVGPKDRALVENKEWKDIVGVWFADASFGQKSHVALRSLGKEDELLRFRNLS